MTDQPKQPQTVQILLQHERNKQQSTEKLIGGALLLKAEVQRVPLVGQAKGGVVHGRVCVLNDANLLGY